MRAMTTPPAPPLSKDPAESPESDQAETEHEATMRQAIEQAVTLLDQGDPKAARAVLELARQGRD